MDNRGLNNEPKNYHLAQVNIARMLEPLHSPVMADFVNNLERINTIAEKSQGYVWRLTGDGNDATSIKIFNDDYLIVNMSVWESLDDLFQFTYQSQHLDIFKRKKEWFSKTKSVHLACWYVPVGVFPTIADAEGRLSYLSLYGETPYAFTFKMRYTPEDALKYKPQTPNPKP